MDIQNQTLIDLFKKYRFNSLFNAIYKLRLKYNYSDKQIHHISVTLLSLYEEISDLSVEGLKKHKIQVKKNDGLLEITSDENSFNKVVASEVHCNVKMNLVELTALIFWNLEKLVKKEIPASLDKIIKFKNEQKKTKQYIS
jgi:hypothetical protein